MAKTIDRRWLDHIWRLENNCHRNSHLQAAWNKYGKDSFEFSVVEECTIENIREREIYYIKFYDSINPEKGYNLTGGGDGEIISREETNKKKSEALKRRKIEYPDLYKKAGEKIKQSFIDNPEKREKVKQKTLQQFANPEFYKKYREYRASEEFKQKISKAHKGRKIPKERVDRRAQTQSKPVMCVETGEIFFGRREAARIVGASNINAVVDKPNRTACGYHWISVNKDAV